MVVGDEEEEEEDDEEEGEARRETDVLWACSGGCDGVLGDGRGGG